MERLIPRDVPPRTWKCVMLGVPTTISFHSRTAGAHSELRKPLVPELRLPLAFEPHFTRFAIAQSCKVRRAQERRCPVPLHGPALPPQTSSLDSRGRPEPRIPPDCTSYPGVPTLHLLSHLLAPREIQELTKPKWQQAGNQAAPELWRVPSPCLGNGATKRRAGARTLCLARLLLSPPVLYL